MHVSQPHDAAPPALQMTGSVYESIEETIGRFPAETGGILGGSRETGQVTHFFFDEGNNRQTGVVYFPNNPLLNHVINAHWKPQGIKYLGSIHSHPPFYTSPSPGDGTYARRILDTLDLPYLLTPIVTTIPDTGSFALLPFVAVRQGKSVSFCEQELIVDYPSGRQPHPTPSAGTPPHSVLVPDPFVFWEAVALAGTPLAFAAGFATAQLVHVLARHPRTMRRK